MAYSVYKVRTENIGEYVFSRFNITQILNDPPTSQAYSPSSTPTSEEAYASIGTEGAENLKSLTKGTTRTLIFKNGQYISCNRASNGRYTFTIVMQNFNASGTTLPSDATDVFWGILMNDEAQKAQFAYMTSVNFPPRYTDYVPIGLYSNDLWLAVKGIIPPEDPYESHNNNIEEPVGGEGNYDESSDTIAEGNMPGIGGNTSGFCTAFVPTLQQINDLADRMVDPNVFQVLGNTVLKISDICIGLSIFPFTVPKITATQQLFINFLGIHLASGVYMDRADGQYHEIDCGSLTVDEYWGNCLDFNPYTSVSIYLPFCGFFELDTDDVMGKTLSIKYRVDIMSGTCLASIIVDGSVMYQYAGMCSSQIPLSSVSFDSFVESMISVAVSTASGGAGLAAAGASAAVGHQRAAQLGVKNAELGQLMDESVEATYHATKVNTDSSLIGSAVNMVMSGKGQYKHAGSISGIAGFMGVKKPYLIIKRPNQCVPSDYGKYHGYPANTKAKLSDLEGYTVVDDIRLNIPDATVDEIIECEKLLKGGIII